MPLDGLARTFFEKYNFVLEIDGLGYAGFKTVSDLAMEVADIEHWEGGALRAIKRPGRLSMDDITLSRGATTSDELYDWFESVANGASGVGAHDVRNASLVQYDREGNELRRWNIFECYAKRFKAGDWENDADEVVIEELVLRAGYYAKAA